MADKEHNLIKEVTYTPETNKDHSQKLTTKNDVNRSDTLFLSFIVISGTMVFVVGGSAIVWTSSAIPKLKSSNTEENPIGRPVSTFEVSMIAGLPSLAMIPGALLLGTFSQLIGRKRCIQIAGTGIFLSSVFLAFSNKIVLIVITRCTFFFFFNGALTVYPVYLTEICEDHNRAKFGCLMGACIPFGSLLGFVLGSFFSVKIYTLMTMTPLLFFVFFLIFAPETPVYALSKGNKEECIKILRKLRRNKSTKEITAEFVKIEKTMKVRSSKTKSYILTLFNTKERRYSMMLAIGPLMVQLLSGTAIILQFLAPIFIEAGTEFNENYLTIIVGIVKLLCFLCTTLVIEKTGRRPMLLISSLGSSIQLFLLGTYFYIKYNQFPEVAYLQWLPLGCIIGFIITYSLGLGPIPLATMGEFFTPDTRSAGISFIMTLLGILVFCTTCIYPFIVDVLGIHWCMWFFSLSCFIGAIFIFKVFPETKGKSIMEIEEHVKKLCNK